MSVRDLLEQPDGPVTGIFRVTAPQCKVSCAGMPYLALDLADNSGAIHALGWPERYNGPTEIKDLALVNVTGRLRTFHDRRLVDLHLVSEVATVIEPAHLITPECCPVIGGVERLHLLLSQFTSAPLCAFNNSVLADDDLTRAFLLLPGSRRHHHSFPGGLLAHSLECADIVASLPADIHRPLKELGMVAALWHDIGKTRTMADWFSRAVLNHDILTLELLTRAMTELDRTWRDGAILLRHILTWNKYGRQGRPLHVLAEMVAAADRISSGLSAERFAFADAKGWRKLQKWHNDRYVRIGTEWERHSDRE